MFSHKVIYHEHLNDTHAAISETSRAILGGSPYASCSAANVCNFWRDEVDLLVHKPAYPLLSPSWSISIISLEQVSAPCQGVRRRRRWEEWRRLLNQAAECKILILLVFNTMFKKDRLKDFSTNRSQTYLVIMSVLACDSNTNQECGPQQLFQQVLHGTSSS